MKALFMQIYGTCWFSAAMFAMQADTMPSWGAFAIGGSAYMLAGIWFRTVVHNA